MTEPLEPTPSTVIINCTPNPEVESAARELLVESVDLVQAGNVAAGSAKLQEAQALLDSASADRVRVVPLDDDQLALAEADAAAHAAAASAHRTAAIGSYIAKIDRYLAQTDVFMLPAAARPVDMSETLAAAIDANQTAWADWRTQLKTLRDQLTAALATTDEFVPPAFPDQPADPHVVLT